MSPSHRTGRRGTSNASYSLGDANCKLHLSTLSPCHLVIVEGEAMAKRVTSSVSPRIRSVPAGRSKRVEAILGRDWKVALPFVLPLVVLMAGLILWPFINAILISFTPPSIGRTE